MENKVLIILGMHRSGTSLIAQWLSKCGLHIGNYLVNADAGNKDGHFEDCDFVKLHEDALKQNGFPVTGLIDEHNKVSDKYFSEKIRINVEFKNRLNYQWGWKDPRTCLFLTIYRAMLPNAKHLIIFRSYSSVVNSLIRRDIKYKKIKYLKNAGLVRKFLGKLFKTNFEQNNSNFCPDKYLKVWIFYNEALLSHIQMLKQKDYILINYSILLYMAPEVFNVLSKQWGFNLNYYDFNSVYKPDFMSGEIDMLHNIKDKTLLDKAEILMSELERYKFRGVENI